MKKTISIFLSFVIMLIVVISVYATNGDIVGHIYSTDIRAYINGVEVSSYNIGDKTVVVIEDILNENSHQYIYNDYLRTLKIFSLAPYYIVEGKSKNESKTGKIIGNIFETDIKTLVYDVTIPTYNIGGKTAVAIEDLGYDNYFSPIGGKYIWNKSERTIKLEFLYQNSNIIPKDKIIDIFADYTMTEANAAFEEVLHCEGGQEYFNFPDYVMDDSNIDVVLPIYANGETIGYYFRRTLENHNFTAFTYYYPEKVKEAEKAYAPYPNKTRENIISHFVNCHSVGEPIEQFDTDEYSFVYISVAMTSSTSYNLLQVYEDGTYIDYRDKIYMQNRSPYDLVLDKVNEKVRFKFGDRYNSDWFTNYEIDLKTGEIKEI